LSVFQAQKPWAKKLEKVIKCKKDYHLACKLERTASNQENNAKNSSEYSPDQVRKLTHSQVKLVKPPNGSETAKMKVSTKKSVLLLLVIDHSFRVIDNKQN
jgi:hypothetical protein